MSDLSELEKREAELMARRSTQHDIKEAELLAAQWAALMDVEAQQKGWTK